MPELVTGRTVNPQQLLSFQVRVLVIPPSPTEARKKPDGLHIDYREKMNVPVMR